MEHLVKLVENKPLNLLGCKNLFTYFLKLLASHIPPLQKRGSQPIRVYGEQSVLSYIAYSSHSSKVWFGLMMVRHLPLICHGLFSTIKPSKNREHALVFIFLSITWTLSLLLSLCVPICYVNKLIKNKRGHKNRNN